MQAQAFIVSSVENQPLKEMSKLYYKAITQNIQNNKCTESEMLRLVGIFERIIKRMATTLARKSWYELKDFYGSKENSVDSFDLTIERKGLINSNKNVTEHFIGKFECGLKSLRITAILKKD